MALERIDGYTSTMRNLKTIFCESLLLTASAPAFANQDRINSWSSVTINISPSQGDIQVAVAVEKESLKSLSLTLNGKALAVPPSEFKDLDKVQLNSIRILSGAFDGELMHRFSGAPDQKDIPYHYVELKFGEPIATDGGIEYNSAQFLFHDGKYQKRTVEKLAVNGDETLEDKAPGEEAAPAGKISTLK